jgi:uncharacterized protein (TIGR03067 family)
MRFALALAALFVTSISFADDKADMKAISGTWVAEKFEIEGSDMTDKFKELNLVMEDGKYTVTIGEQKDVGTVTIDSSKTPKAMDVVGTEGPNKGKKYLCIYELKDGKLTVCYSTDEKNRPTKFESAKDSKTMLVVYKKK